jgi:hypothetical protein
MRNFGALWRIRTHKHIRTMRSVRGITGAGRCHSEKQWEAEQHGLETERLRRRRILHNPRPSRRTDM